MSSPPRLVDIARVVRSKNAGPFQVTLDVMFDTPQLLAQVVDAHVLTPESIAARYAVPADRVRVVVFPPANAIKVTLPRRVSSGSARDTDVYGTQQHTPLLELEVPGANPHGTGPR